jgi:hypothetical protein
MEAPWLVRGWSRPHCVAHIDRRIGEKSIAYLRRFTCCWSSWMKSLMPCSRAVPMSMSVWKPPPKGCADAKLDWGLPEVRLVTTQKAKEKRDDPNRRDQPPNEIPELCQDAAVLAVLWAEKEREGLLPTFRGWNALGPTGNLHSPMFGLLPFQVSISTSRQTHHHHTNIRAAQAVGDISLCVCNLGTLGMRGRNREGVGEMLVQRIPHLSLVADLARRPLEVRSGCRVADVCVAWWSAAENLHIEWNTNRTSASPDRTRRCLSTEYLSEESNCGPTNFGSST